VQINYRFEMVWICLNGVCWCANKTQTGESPSIFLRFLLLLALNTPPWSPTQEKFPQAGCTNQWIVECFGAACAAIESSYIRHHLPSSAILFRHLSWVSSLVLVVWTTKGFRTPLPSLLSTRSKPSMPRESEDTTGCKIFIRGRDIGNLSKQIATNLNNSTHKQ
jgi:hypothetical protein